MKQNVFRAINRFRKATGLDYMDEMNKVTGFFERASTGDIDQIDKMSTFLEKLDRIIQQNENTEINELYINVVETINQYFRDNEVKY